MLFFSPMSISPFSLSVFLNLPFVFDIHDFPSENFFYRRVLKKALGFAVQTKWKIGELERRFNIPSSKVVYWPNGVEIKEFAIEISQKEARQKLNLPLDKKSFFIQGIFLPGKE